MNKKQFDKIRLAMSNYAKINFFQISEKTKQPTNLFCSVYTELKKDDTIERIKQVLSELKYPFEVSESGYELTKHFIIKI